MLSRLCAMEDGLQIGLEVGHVGEVTKVPREDCCRLRTGSKAHNHPRCRTPIIADVSTSHTTIVPGWASQGPPTTLSVALSFQPT